MESNNEQFSFSYSSKQQAEVRRIREKYIPREEDKMEQLRRLDAAVTQKGSAVSLIVGILGTLVLGVGMSLCLVRESFILGIIIGVVGIVGVALAYPVYNGITKKEREKIAPEIIRLTDELMK